MFCRIIAFLKSKHIIHDYVEIGSELNKEFGFKELKIYSECNHCNKVKIETLEISW